MSLYYYYSCLKNKDKIDVKTTLELFYAEERAMTRAFLTASFSKSEALLSLAKLELSSNPSGISHSSLNTSSLISHRLCNTTQLAIFAGRYFSVVSILFNKHRKRPFNLPKATSTIILALLRMALKVACSGVKSPSGNGFISHGKRG